jgi:DNA modification methylase
MKITANLKPYIQPFERKLALQELGTLAGAEVRAAPGAGDDPVAYEVRTEVPVQKLAERLAYWESIQAGSTTYTKQALLEATTNVVRNGIPLAEIAARVPFDESPPLPNRRCLRYGTHGIHEYRGKFFPQLVRALVNIGNVRTRGTVADPMCGSGTTIVEAVIGGYTGLGADINPLSLLMARTKAALLGEKPESVASAYEEVRGALLWGERRDRGSLVHLESLPARDQEYLQAWFPEQVLLDLDHVVSTIAVQPSSPIRDLLWLALSNILRSVSWQKVDDLRVRKEVRLDVEIDPVRAFLEELGRSVRAVLAVQYQLAGSEVGEFSISETDAREVSRKWQEHNGKVDAVITSPPYATALPYLDTDRLSLSYLGLLPRPEHRRRDQEMIGNREVGDRLRREYWEQFVSSRSDIPTSIVQLIEKIEYLNSGTEAGFRRRNLPALLAKYFLDMQEVLQNVRALLRPDGHAFVVIGDNSTTAGHQKININTSYLLADLANRAGLRLAERIPMEMLVSRDIFRKNAVASEVILDLVPA